ncbi:MAG: hypothetical protein M3Y84_08725 [Acidobacteriota bacterium]|nr:hypothetical protein [Acidobacteriota bacterium]
MAAIALTSCKVGNNKPGSNRQSANSGQQSATTSDAAKPGEAGVEKVRPAPGTGNVQGKVLYNSKPAANIKVDLCETFSRFLGGCGVPTYTARTDKDGEYVITNVGPKTYEALIAHVFDTDSYIFATSGIAGLSAAKYDVAADKTFFVSPVNLFKSDLKTLNPKAGAKVSAQNLEIKWEPYPDAAYYKFSIYADDPSITPPYINERVEAASFGLDKPLPKGTYRWQVEAFNKDDRKLSESSDDIKFTVQ